MFEILPGLSQDRYNAAVKVMGTWACDVMVSFVHQYRRKRSLSEKQLALMTKLVEEAEAKAAMPSWQRDANRDQVKANRGCEEAAPVVLDRVVAMFDKAAEQLKAPRVLFAASGVGEFLVRRAKAESRNPGHLYVVMDGNYMGKVAPNGRFYAAKECPAAVNQALVDFNRNPAQAAQAYGQATGNCCFCAKELTDPRSVEVGYGPICASRYGLAWG